MAADCVNSAMAEQGFQWPSKLAYALTKRLGRDALQDICQSQILVFHLLFLGHIRIHQQ
jgi:hypothetical protein